MGDKTKASFFPCSLPNVWSREIKSTLSLFIIPRALSNTPILSYKSTANIAFTFFLNKINFSISVFWVRSLNLTLSIFFICKCTVGLVVGYTTVVGFQEM